MSPLKAQVRLHRTLVEELRAREAAGEIADLTGRTIPAAAIRALLVNGTNPMGVRLRGARITGQLDLRHARGPQGLDCGPLILVQCTFARARPRTRTIDARYARLSRVDLSGCRLVGADFTGAAISGDVVMDGAHIAAGISFETARIDGSISLIDLALNADVRLDLTDAEIGGRLRVEVSRPSGPSSGARASSESGGRLNIDGESLAVGSHLRLAGEMPVVDLSNSQIGGTADLKVKGKVILKGARIGRNLAVRSSLEAFEAPLLQVGGDFALYGSLSGRATLEGMSVTGNLYLGESAAVPLFLDANFGRTRPVLKLNKAAVRLGLHVRGVRLESTLGDDNVVRARVRSAPLTIYPGWNLGEARFTISPVGEAQQTGVVSFLHQTGHPERVVILDGDSGKLYDHATLGRPQLDRPGRVDEYLALFCANVWADEGAFALVSPLSISNRKGRLILVETGEGKELASAQSTVASGPSPGAKTAESTSAELIDLVPALFRTKLVDGKWHASAFVRYGANVFRAEFIVERDGSVEMTHDRPALDDLDPALQWGHAQAPIRWIDGSVRALAQLETSTPPLGRDAKWRDLDHTLESSLWDSVRARVQPSVDFFGLKVAVLDDEDGSAWDPELQLELDGFDYERIHASHVSSSGALGQGFGSWARRPALESRATWLRESPDYRPQPYVHLARLWRGEGKHSDADEITIRRLVRERVETDGPLVKGPARAVVQAGLIASVAGLAAIFGLNLIGVGDAVGAVLIMMALGFGGLLMSSGRLRQLLLELPFGYGLRLRNAVAVFVILWVVGWVGTLSATNSVTGYALRQDAPPPADVACIGQIDPVLYSLDVMVPFLDLHQEQRCRPESGPAGWFARFLKGAYAILGWAAVSGLVLTGSGVVRRQVER